MKISLSCLIPLAALAAVTITGCNKQERTKASTTIQDAYSDAKTSMSNAWNDVRSYSFEKRDDFTKQAKAMSSQMDSQLSELRANYSDARASASRKAAMQELKNDEANYREKLDALGHATSATWDSAKDNVISAWDKLQASYHKARAD